MVRVDVIRERTNPEDYKRYSTILEMETMNKLKELVKRTILICSARYHQHLIHKHFKLQYKYSEKANYHRKVATYEYGICQPLFDKYKELYSKSEVSANERTTS